MSPQASIPPPPHTHTHFMLNQTDGGPPIRLTNQFGQLSSTTVSVSQQSGQSYRLGVKTKLDSAAAKLDCERWQGYHVRQQGYHRLAGLSWLSSMGASQAYPLSLARGVRPSVCIAFYAHMTVHQPFVHGACHKPAAHAYMYNQLPLHNM